MKQDRDTQKIEIRGDRPLLMNDPTKAWLITDGQLDIFTVPLEGAEWGPRDYLFTAPEGTVLLGGVLASGELTEQHQKSARKSYGFLASGIPGMQVIEIELDDLLKRTSKNAMVIIEGLRQWFCLGDKAVGGAISVKFETLIQEDLSGKKILTQLNGLNQELLSHAVRNRLKKVADYQERIVTSNQNKQHAMKQSLLDMVNIVDRDKQVVIEEFENPLFQACLLVAKSRKIVLKTPAELIKNNSAAVTLEDITKVSGFNTREVVLENNWWKNDIGSLLGTMEADGRPVAIIAIKPQTYIVHDITFGRKFKVTAKSAAWLKPKAYMFYRPFPDKILKIKDLALFGYENVWKQDICIFIGIGLLGSIFGMATPKVTELLFNKVIPEGSTNQLIQLASLYFVVLLSKTLFDVTRSFGMKRMEGHLESSVQAAVLDRVTKLPVPFFKQYTTGDLTNRVNAISGIRSIVSGVVINAVISGVFGLVYLVMLFLYSSKLTMVALMMVAVIVIINFFASIISLKYAKTQQVLNNKIHGLVYEFISGVPKFRTAGAEERAFQRWSSPFSKSNSIDMKSGFLANNIGMINTAATTVFSMIFYYMIVVKKFEIELGQFVAFQSAFAIFSSSILGLMKSFIDSNRVIPLYELAKPILETLPEYDAEKPDPGVIKGAIEVKHVNFRYQPDGPLILKDVSLQIQDGEYIGVVGPSGSGKSTLFRALLGFEKPETGQIYYDGKDMMTVDIKALRRQFGVVLQNAHVMSGSIYSNIIGSNYQLTLKDAEAAVVMAGLADDLKQMPMGMHTMVPDGGGTLSGGQKQRLVIARALVKKPKILFFDEATSALDNRTQEIVSQSLKGLNTTRIVIAHRLSTIIDCDRIIVFKDGRIIEEGTYQELMKKAGLFSELAQRQLA